MKSDTRKQFSGRQTIFVSRGQLKIKPKTFAAGDGADGVVTLAGYPIVFANAADAGTSSDDRGGYVVQIPTDAKINWAPQVMALWHHQFETPLGTTANKSLRIGQPDYTGIPIELDLNTGTTIGNDVNAWVQRGDVAGMSFSMANGFEDFDLLEGEGPNGLDIVRVNQFTVDEVTVTAIPAMRATSIEPAAPEPKLPVTNDLPNYAKRIDAEMKMRLVTLHNLALR